MNSALHIGVLPPPDLKSLFSPAPTLISPLQTSSATHPFHSETCHALLGPLQGFSGLGDLFFGIFFSREECLSRAVASFLPRLRGRKGFCINHTALCQALPRPGGASPWTQNAEAECTTELMQCYMVQSKTLKF